MRKISAEGEYYGLEADMYNGEIEKLIIKCYKKNDRWFVFSENRYVKDFEISKELFKGIIKDLENFVRKEKLEKLLS